MYNGTDVAAVFPFLKVLQKQLRSFGETQKHTQNTSDFLQYSLHQWSSAPFHINFIHLYVWTFTLFRYMLAASTV